MPGYGPRNASRLLCVVQGTSVDAQAIWPVMNHQATHGIGKAPKPFGATYAEHRRIFGEKQAERVRIRKVKRELVKLFKEIFA